MNNKQSPESGQILILLVLVVIGLLGFTALAIDGGMIFADRRYMQSAADATSLAAAGVLAQSIQDVDVTDPEFNCDLFPNVSAAYAAAEEQALANDFTVSRPGGLNYATDHGITINCNDADNQSDGDANDNYFEVIVHLSKVTPTSFVHLFTTDPVTGKSLGLRNTVESITQVQPGITAGNGSAIVALSFECGNKVGDLTFTGNTNVEIFDGGIWSNSCNDSIGSSQVTIHSPGSIDYHIGDSCDGMPDPPGCTPHAEPHPITDEEIDPPPCSGEPQDVGVINTPTTLNPGSYDGWVLHSEVTLKPGLYCLYGDVSMTSTGWVQVEEDEDGNPVGGVTIYIADGDGNPAIQINGGVDAHLVAPNEEDDEPHKIVPLIGDAMEDMLLFVNPDLENVDLIINGTSGSHFAGTIYAPTSVITINGNAEIDNPTDMGCSIIGYDVTVSGTSNLNITYDPDLDYDWPSWLSVHK